MLAQRRAGCGLVRQHGLEAMVGHHFEAFDRVAQRAFHLAQQRTCLDDPANPDPGGGAA